MDIEEAKKFARDKIAADDMLLQVRNVIKERKWEKQDMREGFKQTFKPLIKSQDSIKKSIDEQQNKTIEQLKDNQLALTQGLKQNRAAITEGFNKLDEVKRWDLAQLPGFEAIEGPEETEEKEEEEEEDLKELSEKPSSWKKKIAEITPEELDEIVTEEGRMEILRENGFNMLPSEYLKKDLDELDYDLGIAHKELEETKNLLKKNKKITEKKMHAKSFFYDIVEYKTKVRGPNVDTQVNIDKFNALSPYVTSLEYIKIYRDKSGSGLRITPHMIYYNNPHQLLHRLELLGGSIRAGNNGVINEFSQIAHLLNQMKVISNKQLNDLLKKYLV